ncbi:MAG TPA: alcohol dehydrogenase catalytic domain-containing protein [Candidatus Cybelea sp.]|nr:alcohol dehydrogenase catalytic domain-containing protein [Candidatus Cybelea sp.]
MKAAVFQGPGKPLVIENVPDPTPGPAELVLKVKACGICGSDLHFADVHDTDGGLNPLPRGTVMGHEFAGEVVALGGEAKSTWRVGARVTALPYIACGHCAFCLSGKGHRCERSIVTGFGRNPGAYAEYVRVGAYEALALPEQVDYRAGAMVEPLAVGLHAVHAAHLQGGESVLVIGAGPIGLATTLWCRFFGARHVITSDLVRTRMDRAADFGATAQIDASSEDVVERCKQITGDRPQVVFDCVGVPGSQQLAMDYAPAEGRIVVVGVCMQPDRIIPVKAITKELQVAYVLGYRRQDFAFCIDMLASRRVDARAMMSGAVGFERLSATFEALKTSKNECKVMLEAGL